ncbi:MAG: preprotein translocase subunit SecG [Chitinivorax sp.]
MEIFKTIVQVVNGLSALGLIVLVLLQHGKGADMGAAFGSGASGSLFGASGSANFLSRSTAVMALVFFTTCLGLAMFSRSGQAGLGVMSSHENAAPATPAQAPAVPAGKPVGVPE